MTFNSRNMKQFIDGNSIEVRLDGEQLFIEPTKFMDVFTLAKSSYYAMPTSKIVERLSGSGNVVIFKMGNLQYICKSLVKSKDKVIVELRSYNIAIPLRNYSIAAETK